MTGSTGKQYTMTFACEETNWQVTCSCPSYAWLNKNRSKGYKHCKHMRRYFKEGVSNINKHPNEVSFARYTDEDFCYIFENISGGEFSWFIQAGGSESHNDWAESPYNRKFIRNRLRSRSPSDESLVQIHKKLNRISPQSISSAIYYIAKYRREKFLELLKTSLSRRWGIELDENEEAYCINRPKRVVKKLREELRFYSKRGTTYLCVVRERNNYYLKIGMTRGRHPSLRMKELKAELYKWFPINVEGCMHAVAQKLLGRTRLYRDGGTECFGEFNTENEVLKAGDQVIASFNKIYSREF